MTTKTEGQTAGDFLLFEERAHYCREAVTIAAGDDLEPGTVLGKVTADGKYTTSVQGAADGSETPAAVLVTPAAAAEEDVTAVVIVRGPAQVRRGGLIFDASYSTETLRDGACASLEEAGIVAVAG